VFIIPRVLLFTPAFSSFSSSLPFLGVRVMFNLT
jgi:hypothetical protein